VAVKIRLRDGREISLEENREITFEMGKKSRTGIVEYAGNPLKVRCRDDKGFSVIETVLPIQIVVTTKLIIDQLTQVKYRNDKDQD
jgi:hypothetical protein